MVLDANGAEDDVELEFFAPPSSTGGETTIGEEEEARATPIVAPLGYQARGAAVAAAAVAEEVRLFEAPHQVGQCRLLGRVDEKEVAEVIAQTAAKVMRVVLAAQRRRVLWVGDGLADKVAREERRSAAEHFDQGLEELQQHGKVRLLAEVRALHLLNLGRDGVLGQRHHTPQRLRQEVPAHCDRRTWPSV